MPTIASKQGSTWMPPGILHLPLPLILVVTAMYEDYVRALVPVPLPLLPALLSEEPYHGSRCTHPCDGMRRSARNSYFHTKRRSSETLSKPCGLAMLSSTLLSMQCGAGSLLWICICMQSPTTQSSFLHMATVEQHG